MVAQSAARVEPLHLFNAQESHCCLVAIESIEVGEFTRIQVLVL